MCPAFNILDIFLCIPIFECYITEDSSNFFKILDVKMPPFTPEEKKQNQTIVMKQANKN